MLIGMQELLILGGIILAVWFAIIYLRVPAFAAFFSLLVGQLLSAEASTGAYDFVGGVIGTEMRYIQLGLLLLPLILTILFLKGRRSKSKLALDLIPALFVAAVGVVLASPLIPNGENLMQEATNGQVERYTTVLLIAAAVSGLLSAWTSFPKLHEKHGKKH
jgi:hypothetical protein